MEDCCWNKCPVEGTKENLEKLNKCGVEPDQWSFAKTGSSGEERVFIAQAGKTIPDKFIYISEGILYYYPIYNDITALLNVFVIVKIEDGATELSSMAADAATTNAPKENGSGM